MHKIFQAVGALVSAMIVMVGVLFAPVYAGATVPAITKPMIAEANLEPGHAPAEEGDNSFTFRFEQPGDDGSQQEFFEVGGCTGTFDLPHNKADGLIYYGLTVTCFGNDFLPLSARVQLQEEHVATFYETVDEESRQLTEGGYAYVGGVAPCSPSSGHDYRLRATIYAGSHVGGGVSPEIHLPCNV